MRLEDLAIHSTVEALTTNQELFDSFHSHERVVHDEKTGLYSYKVRHSFSPRTSSLTLSLPPSLSSMRVRNDNSQISTSARQRISTRSSSNGHPAADCSSKDSENPGQA